jgi:hypothetical protein
MIKHFYVLCVVTTLWAWFFLWGDFFKLLFGLKSYLPIPGNRCSSGGGHDATRPAVKRSVDLLASNLNIPKQYCSSVNF